MKNEFSPKSINSFKHDTSSLASTAGPVVRGINILPYIITEFDFETYLVPQASSF